MKNKNIRLFLQMTRYCTSALTSVSWIYEQTGGITGNYECNYMANGPNK